MEKSKTNEMQEEDLSENVMFVASIMSRVQDLKSKYKNDDNTTAELNVTKASVDTTDNSGTVNQIMMTANNPEDWLNHLLKLEAKCTPQADTSSLNKLIGRYRQAVASLSAEKYHQNESYARILVRFAELNVTGDPEEARDQFHLARLTCSKFSFVHVAFAQFELSQGNLNKAKRLLEKAVEVRALPVEMLEIAVRNLSLERKQLLSVEEKENLTALNSHNEAGNFLNRKINVDSNEITARTHNSCHGEKKYSPQESERKPLKQLNKSNKMRLFGRVPFRLVSDDEDDSVGMDIPCATSIAKRKISDNNLSQLPLHESKPNGSDIPGDVKPLPSRWLMELQPPDEESSEEATNSAPTLKNKYGSTYAVKQKETEEHNKEPSTIEPSCLERLQHPSVPLENNEKKQLRLNYHASENKWFNLEAMHNTNLEGKNSCAEQPAFQVSKRFSPPESIFQKPSPPETASKINSQSLVGPVASNNTLRDYMACFSTPVVRNNFLHLSKDTTPYNQLSYLQPCTPSTPFQVRTGLPVFQVLDEKKQLYAIKYVNLEEAEQQTLESYKNEIAHLNKLQQHCDKIIRLYDYEISKKSIYMLMECGNIDLNTWLKKKKINPWERKSFWENMLEAVHTIHTHGIVHSDLKPANFLLVDGMLKLIDFGIANQMQPDVTSIFKDSQVGTVNYMPPEVIKDMSSCGENGKPRSKISPKNDVWSLGCILYCMTYGRTPFQHITNQIAKLHAIIDPSHEIAFPDIAEKDLHDVLKRCLVRNPKQRISVSELLVHPYVHIQANSQTGGSSTKGTTEEIKRILGHLVGLNSPNSISRATRALYEQCSSDEGLDVSAFANCDKKTWSTK
nr:dual specificity protein kinase TTK isoform X4 [Zootoca vivipara]